MLPFRQTPDLADVQSVGIPRALLYYRYGVLWGSRPIISRSFLT